MSKMNRVAVGSANERQDKVQSSNVGKFTQYDRGGQSDVDKQENISSPRERLRSASRALASVAVALIAGLGMLPFLGSTAFASGTSVTSPSVSTSPATTGELSLYKIGFTTSSSGALTSGSGTITLSFPGPQANSATGTVFPSTASDYTVNGTVVGTITVSNSSTVGTASTVTITVPANVNVPASSAVTVVVNGVTNPSTPGTYTTATVATSADTVPATIPSYTLTAPPGQVTLGVCCSISASTGWPLAPQSAVSHNPSPDYAGSAATYAFTFTTSKTTSQLPAGGALSAGSGTITVAAPTGTSFPSTASDYVVNGVAASSVSGAGTATATITTPVAIPAYGFVDVVISGVTNPAATASGSKDALTISTSADTSPQTFGSGENYTIAPAPTAVTKVICCSVSSGQAANGNPSPNGTGVPATYGIGFITSPTGALSTSSSPAGSITIEAPAGTIFPASTSDYSINSATASDVSCETSSGGSATCGNTGASTAIVTISQNIGDSTAVNLIVSNVENPSTSSVDDTITVFTSADLMPVTSGNYTIYSSVSNQAVSLTSNVAGASTVYQVSFETSSTGALAANSGSITIDAPSGTVFPTSTGDYTISQGSLAGTPTAAPVISAVTGGGSNDVTIVTPAAIGNSTDVVVTINDVKNPAASTGSGDQLSVSTSSDKATATTTYYSIVAAPSNEVSGVSFSPSSSLAAAQGVTYTVKFTTSSQFATGNTTYNIVGDFSTITITATAGTVWPSAASDYTVNGIPVSASPSLSNSDATVTITSPANVGPNSLVTVSIGGSTNPSVGNHQGTVSTSTDGTSVASSYYVIGTPTTSVTFDLLSQEPNDYAGYSPGQYDYTFTASSTGGLTAGMGTITITSTATTIFPSTASLYIVNGVEASTVSVDPSSCSTPCAIITTPVTIAPDAPVTVNVNGTTNPAVPTSDYSVGVSTSADPVPATSTFTTVATPTAVTGLNLSISPATASASSAKYTFTFTTSSATASGSTYNLESGSGIVTVVVPAGTTLPTSSTSYTVGGVAAANLFLISGVTTTCPSGDCAEVEVGTNISPSTATSLVITGVGNPGAGTTYTASLFTSTDEDPVTTREYSIGTSVGSVELPLGSSTFPYITTNPSPSLAGGSPAEYAVSFYTSSTGALVGGTGTITITGPAGMTMPSAVSDYTVNGLAATNVSVSGDSAAITIPVSVGDGAQVIVVISGATNPPASTSNELMVSTSSDTIPTPSPTFSTGSEVSSLTGPNPTPATEGATNAVYTLDFVTSSTGALSPTSTPPGSVTIDAPPGTTLPSTASAYVFNSTAATVTPTLSATNGSSTDNEAVVDIPVSVAAGGSVALTITGVTNPPSGKYTLSVNTSSDTAPVPTKSYTIGSSVTGTGKCPSSFSSNSICPIVSVNPAVGDETATYSTVFTSSSTGALTAGSGTITVAGPSGTSFPSTASSYVVSSGGNAAAASTVTGGGTDTVTITTPVAVVDSSSVTLTISGVSNPAPGTYNLMINTSTDQIPAASEQYTLATPPAPVVTSISPTVGSTAGGTTVTITGSGFSSGATVDFGTVAGTSVTVVSSTSITVVSPAEMTGTVNVTVTVNGLTSATVSGDQFTYEAAYTALTPARICDTRSAASIGGTGDVASGVTGQCANSGTQLSPSSPLDVTVTGIAGVPTSGVSAVVLNVTAVNQPTSGFVTVYPAGASQPKTSNLNFTANDTVANLVEVGVGSNGQVAISSNTSTDIVVDVEGYYSVPSAAGEGLYNGLSAPARICDTRAGNPSNLTGADAQCNGKTLAPMTSLSVQVTGNGGIPSSGVTAVVLNLTAVGYSSGGYLTAYPGNITTPPLVSNVNFHIGEGPVSNRVIVPVSSSGTINLVSNVTTDAIVDVNGYFTAASSSATGAQFNAEPTPVRILDTRCAASPAPVYCSSENIPSPNDSIGTVGSGKTITVTVAGLANVPKTATAVVLNVTATDTSTAGYLTVYPGSGTPPTTSDLNWTKGATTANLVIATLSSTGTVTIYNFSGTTNVIVDVMGWYQ